MVLTPYRAQRILILACLAHRNVKSVRVSTVHRSQGSEARVVLFDPVKGDDKFLAGASGGRLINVALSRAMGKLVLAISPHDRANPWLEQFYALPRLERNAGGVASVPLVEALAKGTDPHRLVGMQVTIGRHLGKVVRVDIKADRLVLESTTTGKSHDFLLSVLVKKAGEQSPE